VSELRPFLTTVTTSTSPFHNALRRLEVPVEASPWSPKPVEVSLAPVLDVEALRAEARAQGLADGMRETALLRARLAALVTELELARDATSAPAAELIADAASAVVAAWTESTSRSLLFAPIVRSWMARGQASGVARVHPTDLEAMRAAIGDGTLVVSPDEAVLPGDVQIRSSALELSHTWESRLRELREAIATALEESP